MLQAQTIPDVTSPIGKIPPLSKVSKTFQPDMTLYEISQGFDYHMKKKLIAPCIHGVHI